jgi:hypothetical protein
MLAFVRFAVYAGRDVAAAMSTTPIHNPPSPVCSAR